jgi:hypothetical protein
LVDGFASDLLNFYMDKVVQEINLLDHLSLLRLNLLSRLRLLSLRHLLSFFLSDLDDVLHLKHEFLEDLTLVSGHLLVVDFIQGALFAGVSLQLELIEFCGLHTAFSTHLLLGGHC